MDLGCNLMIWDDIKILMFWHTLSSDPLIFCWASVEICTWNTENPASKENVYTTAFYHKMKGLKVGINPSTPCQPKCCNYLNPSVSSSVSSVLLLILFPRTKMCGQMQKKDNSQFNFIPTLWPFDKNSEHVNYWVVFILLKWIRWMNNIMVRFSLTLSTSLMCDQQGDMRVLPIKYM